MRSLVQVHRHDPFSQTLTIFRMRAIPELHTARLRLRPFVLTNAVV